MGLEDFLERLKDVKDRIFQEEIERVKRRLEELKARKVLVGRNRWYWILKPDLKKGEVIAL
ncbi:MAG: hypothetical protein ACK4Z6_03120 [Candidatus Methylomirabilales bacterium]